MANPSKHNNSRKKEKIHAELGPNTKRHTQTSGAAETELSLADPFCWSARKANYLAGAANQVLCGAPCRHMYLMLAWILQLLYKYFCPWKSVNIYSIYSAKIILLCNFIMRNLLIYALLIYIFLLVGIVADLLSIHNLDLYKSYLDSS